MFFVYFAQACSALEVTEDPVSAELTVDEFGILNLKLFNKTSLVLYLDPYNLCNKGYVVREVFDIQYKSRPLPYLGKTRDRPRKQPVTSFIALQPKSELMIWYNLNNLYELDLNKNYSIKYTSYNYYPESDKEYFEVSSKDYIFSIGVQKNNDGKNDCGIVEPEPKLRTATN